MLEDRGDLASMAPRLWVSHFDRGSHTTSYKSYHQPIRDRRRRYRRRLRQLSEVLRRPSDVDLLGNLDRVIESQRILTRADGRRIRYATLERVDLSGDRKGATQSILTIFATT